MKIRCAVAAVSVLALAMACTSPTPPTPQPDEAVPSNSSIEKAIRTVMSGFMTAMDRTRSGSNTLTLDGLRAGEGFLPGARSFTSQCNQTGTSCSTMFNETFSQSLPCGNGGTTNLTSTLTGVVQSGPTFSGGTLNLAVRTTFTNCSEDGWVINATPSIATNASIYLTNNHTRLNVTMSGEYRITNAPGAPAGGATCALNAVMMQWDDITGTWANSGSVDCVPGGSIRFSEIRF